MVHLTPEPRKDVFLSVAVTPEMRVAMKDKAKDLNMSVSELLRILGQKFLAGDFDHIEEMKPRRSSAKSKKRANKPRKIGGK